jgi:hypothetical protein
MYWDGANAKAHHAREPWTARDKVAWVHCRNGKMTGDDYAPCDKYEKEYQDAKDEFHCDAAANIVGRCLNQDTMNELIDIVYYFEEKPIIVFPHPAFDDEDIGNVPLSGQPTNAIPFAYANILAEVLGGDVNETIIQSSRVGTTRLPRWMRYLCQASFEGDVDRRRPYILADDMISSGGTFATLRTYIVREGGIVACTTALASNNGLHEKFAIADQTLGVLRSAYGQHLDKFWLETFGHGLQTLTESEAVHLLRFVRQYRATSRTELLHGLRERINQAAATCR